MRSLILLLLMTTECIHGMSDTAALEAEDSPPRIRDRRLPKINPRYVVRRRDCLYRPGYRKINRKAELKCCEFWEKRFYARWHVGNEYLTSFLDLMRSWQCPQLRKHCQNKYFNFSPFTDVVYMRACKVRSYRRHCFDTVNNIALSHTNGRHNTSLSVNNVTRKEWSNMLVGLQSKDMSDEEISDPCVQVALYEGGRGGHGRFHETIRTVIPFCGFVWCGYDIDTVYSRHISVWRCMPTRCHAGIAVIAVVIICLGVAILLANVMVVAVYWYRERMNKSQVVYKVTLAIGDTLVGAIVLPTFVTTMFMMYNTRNVMGDRIRGDPNVTLYGVPLLPSRLPNGNHVSTFPNAYLSAVGFFTTASFLISVYTLMLAGFDRMVAICFPLSFIRSKALRVAKYSCLCLAVVVFFIATLPIYVDSITYGVVAAIIISLGTRRAVIVYSILFLLPLLLVWISNVILMIYSKRFTAIRRSISSVSNTQILDAERRLAKTLSIMVGAFTLTVLPVILVLVASLFISNIHLNDPENLNETATAIFNSVEIIAAIVLGTNSLWNYFIYGSRDKEFKQHSKAVTRAIADRLGLIYMWKRIYLSSRRLSNFTSNSSGLTSLSTSKPDEANRNLRPLSKSSISGDPPDDKQRNVKTISVRKIESDETKF